MTRPGTAAPDPPVELAAFDAAIPLADVDAACRDAAAWNAAVLARGDAGPRRRKQAEPGRPGPETPDPDLTKEASPCGSR
jgi:hypothetical protein